ncbi:MAG: hypothetical protein WB789_09545 [Thermoplasmata archaeon]
MPLARNEAAHRFLLVWQVSLALKVLALALLFFVAVKLLGGS